MKISRWTFTLLLMVAAFAGGAAWALQSGLAGAQTDNQPGAVVFTSDRSGSYDIYILDPETGVTTQLTNAPGADIDPMWSPDGEYVAFASDRDGDFELFVMKKDGTDVRQLTANNAKDIKPVWQPNGLFIMYSSDVNGNWDLFVISADGAAVRQLTNDTFDERGPGAAEATETPVVPVATPLPAATATPLQPDAVVTSFQLNIRQSPGLGAAILVTIPQNSTLDIIGRLQDNSWLQVTTTAGQQGWAAASLLQINIDLNTISVLNVPVINPPPTATPAPVVPTAAPTSSGPVPVVIEFTADKTTISSGQCANLTWRVEGIKAVYLQGGGVVGSGTVQVCPTTTTTYNLKVIKLDNVEDNRYITITVQ